MKANPFWKISEYNSMLNWNFTKFFSSTTRNSIVVLYNPVNACEKKDVNSNEKNVEIILLLVDFIFHACNFQLNFVGTRTNSIVKISIILYFSSICIYHVHFLRNSISKSKDSDHSLKPFQFLNLMWLHIIDVLQ